jgi:hypothetical protein
MGDAMAEVIDLDAYRERRAFQSRIAQDIARAVISVLTDGDHGVVLDPDFPKVVHDLAMERLASMSLFEEVA